jgi:C4-dicarboxylate-specific signal transduction histidine kinase
MVEYSREDFISGRLRWTDLTPAEWRDGVERAAAEIKAAGAFRPFRKEYLRKNGSRIPVMIGGALFEQGGSEGVAFVLDLSEQRRAEEALREKEFSLHETQTELAHLSRLTTMGELAASIAHEVNQQLVGVITNASAGLRFLAGDSPDLIETREALRAIIRDGNRAADVVSRVRGLFKKARPTEERLNINQAIEEVVILTQGEARRTRWRYGRNWSPIFLR